MILLPSSVPDIQIVTSSYQADLYKQATVYDSCYIVVVDGTSRGFFILKERSGWFEVYPNEVWAVMHVPDQPDLQMAVDIIVHLGKQDEAITRAEYNKRVASWERRRMGITA